MKNSANHSLPDLIVMSREPLRVLEDLRLTEDDPKVRHVVTCRLMRHRCKVLEQLATISPEIAAREASYTGQWEHYVFDAPRVTTVSGPEEEEEADL